MAKTKSAKTAKVRRKPNRFVKKPVPTEDPQVQQRWHCEQCGYVTTHVAKPGRTVRAKWGISRVHVCEDCTNELSTLELRHESFDKLRIALIEARSSGKKLLKSLDEVRNSADNEFASLEEAIETLEKPEPNQSRPIPTRPAKRLSRVGTKLL